MITTLAMVDEGGVRDEIAEQSRPPANGTGDVDRVEALEHQVRQFMGRLAGWVESQLIQAVDGRRSDLRALRAELQFALSEQASEPIALLAASIEENAARAPAFEERVQSAVRRFGESLEATLAESASGHLADLDTVRGELRAVIDERVAGLASSQAELQGRLDERLQGSPASSSPWTPAWRSRQPGAVGSSTTCATSCGPQWTSGWKRSSPGPVTVSPV